MNGGADDSGVRDVSEAARRRYNDLVPQGVDLPELDRIADANQAILDYIRSLPDGRITAESRPGYERLVAAYFAAVHTPADDRAAA